MTSVHLNLWSSNAKISSPSRSHHVQPHAPPHDLGPSINRLVTDRNTKLCCRGFILALFQSTTANKIDSEHTRDYNRLLLVCQAEILRVTIKIIELFSSFYVDF